MDVIEDPALKHQIKDLGKKAKKIGELMADYGSL
jgi:hypothetical protein